MYRLADLSLAPELTNHRFCRIYPTHGRDLTMVSSVSSLLTDEDSVNFPPEELAIGFLLWAWIYSR